MEKVIFTAMSGARHALMAQQIHANNLANVGTTGFRADYERVAAHLLQGDGFDSRVMAQELAPGTDFSPGALVNTGRNLDVGIRGEGFLTVQTADGQEAYTRAGDLTVSADGSLTLHGQPVLGEGGALVLPDYQALDIGPDGTVTVTPPGGGALLEAGRLKLVNPEAGSLVKGTDGLFRLTDGSQAEQDESVVLNSGMLEDANVNPVDEMIQSLQMTRNFELQVKLMQAADEQAKQGNDLVAGT
ncbi:flagellar basal body rod protein FlgF [Pseudaeromonas sp. ZJS20]|uniref:flagellar basal body rod protein FlgF n=1 Tax=Pseudaeromonas aegiceratis TaxID=3153928 RepID=UPI00390CAB33